MLRLPATGVFGSSNHLWPYRKILGSRSSFNFSRVAETLTIIGRGLASVNLNTPRSSSRFSSSQLREAVRAPLFRADSIVDEEQPVGIVLSLDFSEARVVISPVHLLPSFLEVIALAHVCSRLSRDSSKLIHALIDPRRSLAAFINRRFVAGNSRISGSLAVGHDRQR